jgi:hypothetical protein
MKKAFNPFTVSLMNLTKTQLRCIFRLISRVMLALGAAILDNNGSGGLPVILLASDSQPGTTGG